MRIGLFVDVQNIYYTTKAIYNQQFDYRKLWQQLAAQGNLVVAHAYATNRQTPDAGQQKFQAALRHIGFDVKLKPYIQRADGSAKGDWDVGITIDILDAAPNLDQLVLLSGDGDFDLLLHRVKQQDGLSATVYGVPQLTANSLITAADKFCPINEGLLLNR